eukprot:jgi/Bigna1/134504/aug1.25_g9212
MNYLVFLQVAEAYKSVAPDLIRKMWACYGVGPKEVKAMIAGMAPTVLHSLKSIGRRDIELEIRAMATIMGIDFGELLALNMSYEMHMGCTAILAPLKDSNTQEICLALNGTVGLGTLDWELPVLQHLTINLSFVRNGKTLYNATTWAGYVGMLTGASPHGKFALAINFRQENTPQFVNATDAKTKIRAHRRFSTKDHGDDSGI